jgi:hypothetical protein
MYKSSCLKVIDVYTPDTKYFERLKIIAFQKYIVWLH